MTSDTACSRDRECRPALPAVTAAVDPSGPWDDENSLRGLAYLPHLSPAVATISTNPRVAALSARLACLAVEVDELAWQLIAEPLSEPDGLLLAAPAGHMAMALEWVEQALYECERFDLRTKWARSLRDGRKQSDPARAEGRRDSRSTCPRAQVAAQEARITGPA